MAPGAPAWNSLIVSSLAPLSFSKLLTFLMYAALHLRQSLQECDYTQPVTRILQVVQDLEGV